MGAEHFEWPQKSRDLQNHHMDSTIWDDFQFRDDDVVIATYAKSGTTWTQQIVGQLIFKGRGDIAVSELSPWVDLRVPTREEKLAMLEAQDNRRFVKTHLPVDALVFSPDAKYIYIGRDGRDVVWSLYNHHVNANALWYELLNDTPGRVGPAIEMPRDSAVDYFREWMNRDGYPFWPFWENVRSWWQIKDLPNVLFVHFENLKSDLSGEIRRIAAFLDIELDAEIMDRVVDHSGFEFMKANAANVAPLGGAVWDGGAGVFIHKGTNGRWKDALEPSEVSAYDALAREQLGAECANWLETGQM